MSCGCKTSGDSGHSCGIDKSTNGCEKVDTCQNSYKLNVFDWLSNIAQPNGNQCKYVEVRFKNDRKCFCLNSEGLPLQIGSIITVESNPGHDVGVVSLIGELVKIQMKKKQVNEDQILKIYRIATPKDIETWQEARKKEETVKIEARKIARNLRLEMKITNVEYQGDGGKITFYYTSEGRVDFRALIKEYAMAFRTKIDMKQIGYRQEAAKVGGIGSCGRELCCSTWLTDFRSVNIQAARYQQLSINSQKLAGQCGKLKCCLNYELDSYVDALSDFPSSSTVLETEKGRAHCIKIDVFRKKMWFTYADSSINWFDLDIYDVKKFISINKKGQKIAPLEDFKVEEKTDLPIDLIGGNSVDRFEKKNDRNKNSRSRNRNNSNKETKVKQITEQQTSPIPKQQRNFQNKKNNSLANNKNQSERANAQLNTRVKKPFKKNKKRPPNQDAKD